MMSFGGEDTLFCRLEMAKRVAKDLLLGLLGGRRMVFSGFALIFVAL